MTPLDIIRGDVNRWHSHKDRRLRNSGDTIHAHSCRVAIILIHIGAPLDTLRHAALHDAAEAVTGDMPYTAKKRWPDLSAMIKSKEAEIGIDADPSPWLSLADTLDAYLWMMDVAPDLARRDDWKADLARIEVMADGLDVRFIVDDLITEARIAARS